jgi:hypothetical protein
MQLASNPNADKPRLSLGSLRQNSSLNTVVFKDENTSTWENQQNSPAGENAEPPAIGTPVKHLTNADAAPPCPPPILAGSRPANTGPGRAASPTGLPRRTVLEEASGPERFKQLGEPDRPRSGKSVPNQDRARRGGGFCARA